MKSRSSEGGGFANSRLTGLDLSKATSLVEIRDGAFSATNLEGMLVIPANVTMIGMAAFSKRHTKLSSIDLSKAIFLVSIGDSAFSDTGLEGTLVIPANVATIGPFRQAIRLPFAGAVDNAQAYGTRPLEGGLTRGDRGRRL